MRLDNIGFIILCTVWAISYYFKHISDLIHQIVIDYYITFGYCIGTSLIAYYYGKKCKKRRKKILFYYTIAIYNISIVITYLIDFVIDDFFGTKKVIYTILLTTFISLCIYLFKPRH